MEYSEYTPKSQFKYRMDVDIPKFRQKSGTPENYQLIVPHDYPTHPPETFPPFFGSLTVSYWFIAYDTTSHPAWLPQISWKRRPCSCSCVFKESCSWISLAWTLLLMMMMMLDIMFTIVYIIMMIMISQPWESKHIDMTMAVSCRCCSSRDSLISSICRTYAWPKKTPGHKKARELSSKEAKKNGSRRIYTLKITNNN